MNNKNNNEDQDTGQEDAINQAEIEARVKEMMDLEPQPKPRAKTPVAKNTKTINVMSDDDDADVPAISPATAPELPGTKKPLAIKVIDHNEIATDQPEPEVVSDAEVVNDPKPDTNDKLETQDANDQDVATPEQIDDMLDETPAPQTESDQNSEAPSAPVIEEATEQDPAEDSQQTKDPEPGVPIQPDEESDVKETKQIEPPEEAKEKPLKHLDSIVPKTKIDEVLDSTKTDEAVNDIVAKEGDTIIALEDEKIAVINKPKPKSGLGHRLKSFFGKKSVRRTLVVVIFAIFVMVALFPATRYTALNTLGVRSSASITVTDQSTQQPLRGVKVMLAEKQATTDQNGYAAFTDLKLGPSEMIIEKRAFASISKDITIGWGSNPIQDVSLNPTGTQYSFVITDFLSGKPISKAEVTSNEASAVSNEKGEVKLTIDQQDDTPRNVTISYPDYRQETMPLNLEQKDPLQISLVVARKQVYISKRSGTYDVYKIDIDGKNDALVLPGTGSERDDMVLVSHPSEEAAALVSTKDNKRNKDGFLLSTLTVMNLNDQTVKSVVTSERVQIIDWIGSKIVYVAVKEGASGDSPDRHKLSSYDYKTSEYKDIASSNYFNDVMVAGGKVYFAPSSVYATAPNKGLFRTEADGTDKQTIITQETTNIFRTTYDKLTLSVGQDWYELPLGDIKPAKMGGEPPSQVSRVYVDSPDKKRSLWVDIRDGKGVLLAYNTESKKDDTIRTQAGLRQPVRWLNNSVVVYRINTESETADYVLNLDGGEPKKIHDVTNTSGVNSWYYY